MKKINIITLGCSKNLVDSERIARQLQIENSSIDFEGNHFPYDATLVNTCGFIHDAKTESIETILTIIDQKEKFGKVLVFGCLTQLFKEELQHEIPEVDTWFGKYDLEKIVLYLNAKLKQDLIHQRVVSTPSHYAYLKISEGCNRKCAFCSIPEITGQYKSVPIEELVKEATWLAKKGAKELILIAQDLTWYGRDLEGKPTLTALIEELSKIEAIQWIRLHYAYPVDVPVGLFETMNTNPKVCRYLDIPFQHASDKVLRAMKRGHANQQNMDMINRARKKVPGISLRTTLMVGFPGESEDDFHQLMQFTRKAQFEKMGAFTYSHEEFTYAGKNYDDGIPQTVKQKRLDQLMDLQYTISLQNLEKRVGNLENVIIDRVEKNKYFGRSEFESPEIDGEIVIEPVTALTIGEFYTVRITGNNAYDLYGEIV